MENNNPIINTNENQNNINDNPNSSNNPSDLNNFNNCNNTSENKGNNNVNDTEIQKNEIIINSEEKIEYTKNTNEIEENIELGGAWKNIDSFNIDKFEMEEQNDIAQLPTEKTLSDKSDQKYLKKELNKLSVINKLFSIKNEHFTVQNDSVLY